MAELLDVTDKLNVMVRELSLGERMKMELIAALLHSPRVLFLDEPTIGLDVTSQKKVREFLRLYNGEHRIITMLTSHYMQDIEELCERVIIIDHGKIHYDGPLAEIIDRFATYKLVSLVFEGRAEGRDFQKFGEIVEQTPMSVQLKVPRAKVAETCKTDPGSMPGAGHQCAGAAGGRGDPPGVRQRGENLAVRCFRSGTAVE